LNTQVACGNSGKWDAAFDLFNDMKHDDIRPDLVAYNALLAAGMNGNRPEEVSKSWLKFLLIKIELTIRPNACTSIGIWHVD
jgi:pentatricopeptide repeat protein